MVKRVFIVILFPLVLIFLFSSFKLILFKIDERHDFIGVTVTFKGKIDERKYEKYIFDSRKNVIIKKNKVEFMSKKKHEVEFLLPT